MVRADHREEVDREDISARFCGAITIPIARRPASVTIATDRNDRTHGSLVARIADDPPLISSGILNRNRLPAHLQLDAIAAARAPARGEYTAYLIREAPEIVPPLGAITLTGFCEVSVLMIKYSRRVVTAGNVMLTQPEAALATTV